MLADRVTMLNPLSLTGREPHEGSNGQDPQWATARRQNPCEQTRYSSVLFPWYTVGWYGSNDHIAGSIPDENQVLCCELTFWQTTVMNFIFSLSERGG